MVEDDDEYCDRVGDFGDDSQKSCVSDAITYKMGQEPNGIVCYLPGPDPNKDKGRWKRTPEEMCDYISTNRNENDPTLDAECWADSECENDNVPFNKMWYCHFNIGDNMFKKIMFVPIYSFMFFIFMYNMSTTADEYLSPALEFITVKFSIPESLAGVTLLAFGNGAPDVFSSISSGDDNAINSMSPLFGSSLFITTVVILLVTKAGVKGAV